MLVIFGDRIQYHKDTYFRVPACKEDKWQKEGQGLKFSIKKKKGVSRAWCESTFRCQYLQTQARVGSEPHVGLNPGLRLFYPAHFLQTGIHGRVNPKAGREGLQGMVEGWDQAHRGLLTVAD